MKIRRLILISVWLLLAACGYSHPGARPAAVGAITIQAGTWENRTNELALEGLLLQKTGDWLQQARLFHLVADPEQADYILSGTIEAVNFPATAFNANDRASTLNAWAKVTYRLRARVTGQTVWEIRGATRERSFQAADDVVLTRSNREEALAVIADELAEQIYLKVLTSLSATVPEPAK